MLWFVSTAENARFWDRAVLPERLRFWVRVLLDAKDSPDSLDHFALVMETEEEFGISFPSSVILTIRRPAHLAEYWLASPPNTEEAST